MSSDRDADYEILKRVLLTPIVRTLRIMKMHRQGRYAKEIAGIVGGSEASIRKAIQRTKRKLSNYFVTL